MTVLAIAQLALPRLAEEHVRDRLGGAAEVTAVELRAFPAIELLWRHADRLTARVRSYDAESVDLADELAQARGVAAVDLEFARVRAPRGLLLEGVRFRKRADLLGAAATVDGRRLAAALPQGVDLRLVPQEDGAIVLAGSVGGLGVRVRVVARDGRLVARPDGLIGAFTGLTLFSDPRIAVEDVIATSLGGDRYLLVASGRMT